MRTDSTLIVDVEPGDDVSVISAGDHGVRATFAAKGSSSHIAVYLSPDEADRLADALRRSARLNRAAATARRLLGDPSTASSAS